MPAILLTAALTVAAAAAAFVVAVVAIVVSVAVVGVVLALEVAVFKLMKFKLCFGLMMVLNFFELDALTVGAPALDAVRTVVLADGLLRTSTLPLPPLGPAMLDEPATPVDSTGGFPLTLEFKMLVGGLPVVIVDVACGAEEVACCGIDVDLFRFFNKSFADFLASSKAFTGRKEKQFILTV